MKIITTFKEIIFFVRNILMRIKKPQKNELFTVVIFVARVSITS